MTNEVVRIFYSDSRYLSDVRAFIHKSGSQRGLGHDVIHDVILAVNEAYTNIIKHSYQGDKKGKIVIKSSFSSDLWRILIEDYGRPVEKENIKHRNLSDVKPGGLGVFFIKSLMDNIEYIRDESNNLNRLVLEKKLIAEKEHIMERVNEIAIVNFQGDIDLYKSPDVRKQLGEYILKKIPGLIVDLKDVTFIDSSGLATLIEALQKTKKYGGKLYLSGINEKIKNVFEISRLDDIFTVCSDVEEAKERYKKD